MAFASTKRARCGLQPSRRMLSSGSQATGANCDGIEVAGRRALACAFGGEQRQTLFCLSAATSYEELRQGKSSSRIDAVELDIGGAGYP